MTSQNTQPAGGEVTRADAIAELNRQQVTRWNTAKRCSFCHGDGEVYLHGKESPTGHRTCLVCQGLGIEDGWQNPVGVKPCWDEKDIADMRAQLALSRQASAQSATPVELTLDNAPLGTKALAFNGGHWIRVEEGWKWCTGDTFPRPSGDWTGSLVAPPASVPAGDGYPDDLEISVPAIGSAWKHSNGDTYTVTGYADMFSDSHQKRPPRVIYKSAKTARIWSRELSDWHRAMKALAASSKAESGDAKGAT